MYYINHSPVCQVIKNKISLGTLFREPAIPSGERQCLAELKMHMELAGCLKQICTEKVRLRLKQVSEQPVGQYAKGIPNLASALDMPRLTERTVQCRMFSV